MDLSEIHFHDSGITKVVEDPEKSDLLIHVEYPVDWENNLFEPRILIFRDFLNYEIHEGPFHGSPTILEVNKLGDENGRVKLKIETNAGFRTLKCVEVSLVSPEDVT